MNLEPLKRVFWQPVSEAKTTTSMVLTLPSSLTKDMAKELVDLLPMEQLVQDLATIAASAAGDLLITRSLRPADYKDMKELPDAILEHLIEELAKKPDVFFKTFSEQMQLKG